MFCDRERLQDRCLIFLLGQIAGAVVWERFS